MFQVYPLQSKLFHYIPSMFQCRSPCISLNYQCSPAKTCKSSHLIALPSGKLTYLWKITVFNGRIHYKWSFSMAMLNYQRVNSIEDPEIPWSPCKITTDQRWFSRKFPAPCPWGKWPPRPGDARPRCRPSPGHFWVYHRKMDVLMGKP